MEPPLTIASLPPDVIRAIIRLEENSEAELRLISASWNSLWKEYYANRKSPLERVHLSTGILKKWIICLLPEEKDERHQVIMHAILPDRHACKVGIGSWLSVFHKHSGDAIEVICDPTLVTYRSEVQVAAAALSAFCLFCSCLMGYLADFLMPGAPHFAYAFVALSVIGLIATALCVYWCWKLVEDVRKKRARFARFFTMFSHIETLVLDHFNGSEDVLDYVRETLKGVRIDRLEIKGPKSRILEEHDKEMQSRIIKLCRDHIIRHVFIETTGISNDKNLGKFAAQISKLGVTLDLYETATRSFNNRSYFNHSITSLNQMSNNLRKDGIFMSMVSIHDAAFLGYPSGVKSHMRFEQSDGYNLQPLQPLEISRGFIL